MNQIIRTTITIFTAAITLTSIASSAVAGQKWSGNGVIIDGLGAGTRVDLDLDVSGNEVIIQSSPSSG